MTSKEKTVPITFYIEKTKRDKINQLANKFGFSAAAGKAKELLIKWWIENEEGEDKS